MRSLSWALLAAAGLLLAGSALAQTPDPAKWAELQQKAKEEGHVVVAGPAVPGLQAGFAEAFKKRYGITLDYVGMNPGQLIAKIDTESKAHQVSIDVDVGGISSCWFLGARGDIRDMNGTLIDPAILDPADWRGGKMRLQGPGPIKDVPDSFVCALQSAEWVMTDLFVNTSMVEPSEITSWKDLLKPEYKGKIAAYDPRPSGPGQTTAGYLAGLFGDDYLKALYVGQNVELTADNRQLAEWVARGEYPIGLALVQFAVELYRKQGLPIARVFPKDGEGSLVGGFGVVMLIKDDPHPAAGQLFANWFATQEAQTIYEASMLEPSLRTDITGTNVPDYVRLQPGVAYPVDDYSYAHFSQVRQPAIEYLQKILPR